MATDTKVFESAQARLLARRTELRQRRDRVGRDLARQNEPLAAARLAAIPQAVTCEHCQKG